MAQGGGYDEALDILPFIRKVNQRYEEAENKNKFLEFKPDPKDNSMAQEYISKAEEMYLVNRYLKSIEFYTRAIACSVDRSNELASAYIGRAEALMSAGYFKECLAELEIAETNPRTPEAREKFDLVKRSAERKLESQDTDDYDDWLPNVPGDENKRIKCASKALEIRENAQRERHVLAARDILVGEVIAVEKPYVTYLNTTQDMVYCYECLKPCLTLIPCLNCTQILFCGKNCRKLANKKYHKYECSILKTIRLYHNMESTSIALQMILRNKKILSDISAFTPTGSAYCSDRLAEFLRLPTHLDRIGHKNFPDSSYDAALLYDLLLKHSTLFEEFPSENSRNNFKGLLLMLSQIVAANFFEIENVVTGDMMTERVTIGKGGYSFLSLLDHSCAPNAFMAEAFEAVVLIACTDVKKGERIFGNNQLVHYTYQNKELRQSILKREGSFVCTCKACENDWPMFEDLECYDKLVHNRLVSLSDAILKWKFDPRRIQTTLDAALEEKRTNWKVPSCEYALLEGIIARATPRLVKKQLVVK